MAFKKYRVKWKLIHNGKVYKPGEHSLNLRREGEDALVRAGVIEPIETKNDGEGNKGESSPEGA